MWAVIATLNPGFYQTWTLELGTLCLYNSKLPGWSSFYNFYQPTLCFLYMVRNIGLFGTFRSEPPPPPIPRCTSESSMELFLRLYPPDTYSMGEAKPWRSRHRQACFVLTEQRCGSAARFGRTRILPWPFFLPFKKNPVFCRCFVAYYIFNGEYYIVSGFCFLIGKRGICSQFMETFLQSFSFSGLLVIEARTSLLDLLLEAWVCPGETEHHTGPACVKWSQ